MIWLLRFEWAGQSWYFAQEQVIIEDPQPDGTTNYLQHAGTLEAPEFQEMISWATSSVGSASASVKFRLDLGEGREVPHLHFEGQKLETAFGELSLWTPGDPYGARVVQLSGPYVPDIIPLIGKPLEGTITQRITTTADIFPPSSAQATDTTFPDLPTETEEGDDENGLPYPLWIGAGGQYVSDVGNTVRTSCIQCILVDTAPNTLLVSYQHMTVATVRIWSVENESAEDFATSNGFDGLGQPVTTADISGAAWTWATGPETDTFYVNQIDGGVQSPFRTGPILGAGEAILYLLLQRYKDNAPDLVDIPAWQTARPYLDQVKIGLLIREGVDPLDTITNSLLPLLPALYIVQGPRGLRPIVIESTIPADCPHLTAYADGRDGPDLFREPDANPELVMGDPANTVTVYFARRLKTGDFKGTAQLDPSNHAGANASFSYYGARAHEIEAPAVYDRASAYLIAGEYLRLYSTRVTWDSWACSLAVGASLYLGQRIRVTDEQAGYDARPMTVAGRQIVTSERGQEWLITTVDY